MGWRRKAPLELREIFTPGGLPSITYVSREHLELEKHLSEAFARGFAFVVVTGPTKSGKSVLCSKVLQEKAVVSIEGGQIRTENDFWAHIVHKLSIAFGSSTTSGNTLGTTVTTEAGAGIPVVAQGKAGFTKAKSDQSSSTFNYANVPVLAALDRLLESKSVLMVEDFHYIEPVLQKALIQSLKGPVFNGLQVVLLAVPHRAFDLVVVENEVEGRFKHIEIPNWALNDLLHIPERGFSALNVSVKSATLRSICEDSFGNPLLVQEICSEFCLKNGVKAAQKKILELDSALLEPTYRAMAESKGFPIYQKLKRGPEGRRARRLRKIRAGGETDLYSALLASVARLGPKATTSLEEIRVSLREVFAEDVQMPDRGEIVSCLSSMSDVAKKMQGEPPLEWTENRQLQIIDPFLLFCLKWAHR